MTGNGENLADVNTRAVLGKFYIFSYRFVAFRLTKPFAISDMSHIDGYFSTWLILRSSSDTLLIRYTVKINKLLGCLSIPTMSNYVFKK